MSTEQHARTWGGWWIFQTSTQSGYRPCTMHSFECISRGLGTLLLKRIVFAWRLRIGPSPRCEPQLRVGVEVDERRHISMVPHKRLHLRDLCIRAE